jgi:anti-sigma factor RsiW
MSRIELTCQELAELVSDYLEGALPWRQRLRFRLHIAGCRNCSRYVEQMRTTIVVAGRIHAEEIDPAVRDELLAAFRGWKADPG